MIAAAARASRLMMEGTKGNATQTRVRTGYYVDVRTDMKALLKGRNAAGLSVEKSGRTEDLMRLKGEPTGDSRQGEVVEISPRTGMFHLQLGMLWRYRELLYFLIWRDLKVRYKQAVIGVGWAMIQPVLAVAVFTIVFGYFARLPSDGIPYPLFAFAGMLPWTYFAEALRRTGNGLIEDSELIRKIYFPRLIIPLVTVTTPLVDLLLSLVVIVILMGWYGIAPNLNVLLLPLFVLVAMVVALAIGLWLGPLNARYRDVKHTLPFMIQIWMYASPIVYPVSMVPEEWRAIYSLNPMVGVIEGFRWALVGTPAPDVAWIGTSSLLVITALLGGVVYFRSMERSLADVV